GRLRFGADDLSGRSCGIGTWCWSRACRRTTFVSHAVNSAANVIGDVERSIRPDRQTARTMFSTIGSLHCSCESVGKDLAVGGGMAIKHWLKHNVVSALRIRRAVPRSVKSDEQALPISLRELFLIVVNHSVGGPVSGKCGGRRKFVGALADALAAVSAIFRCKHQLLLPGIVIAFRPPVVTALLEEQDFFGGKRGFFFRLV